MRGIQGKWTEAAVDYQQAANISLQNRDRRMYNILQAQSAFALYESNQVQMLPKP
jgi:hypothetical protein